MENYLQNNGKSNEQTNKNPLHIELYNIIPVFYKYVYMQRKDWKDWKDIH